MRLDLPTLISTRLVLEPLSFAHSAGMFELWRCEEVCRYSGPATDYDGWSITLPAMSPADSDSIIDFFVRSTADGTRFRWALLSRDSGRFLGAAGFNRLGPCSEYAYHMIPAAWGAGLMTEASRLALDWLRGRAGAVEVEAFIAPENLASARLATRLGLSATGEINEGACRYSARL